MGEPFATHADLEVRWRPLSDSEQATAQALLVDASAFVRAECRDVDARLGATPATLDADIPRAVVCAMVKRAMLAGLQAGVTAQQQTAGPFAQSLTFSNPAGDLYLTKAEKRRLTAPPSGAFSVDTAPGVGGIHLPWCSLAFGATYCSCGADIAGFPLFESPDTP